ncbi:MAG TPA: thioredoxin-disulfide reductase [Bacteroidetes bacterium]|nr:thioredoxin-disulfide reductase [Bacteroidota bacterium]
MKETLHYRLVILGSGPAGLTAAIYVSRAQLKPLLIEGAEPGGQLMITTTVENFPGFPEGINGPKLMMNMREQAENFGTVFLRDQVEAVDLSKRPFLLRLGEETVSADALIIATGASANWLGLASEKKLRGYGVSACATCDGFFFKNQEVVVVGGGDSALEDAVYLTRFAAKVTVIHRRDQLRASRYLQEKSFKSDKIQFIWDSVVMEILGTEEEGVKAVKIQNRKTGEISEYPANGVFIAIGHTPNTQIFKGQLDMDGKGYILTKCKTTETSVPGVFAAGDVQDSVYRQAISAAGTGCMAALDAERFLAKME